MWPSRLTFGRNGGQQFLMAHKWLSATSHPLGLFDYRSFTFTVVLLAELGVTVCQLSNIQQFSFLHGATRKLIENYKKAMLSQGNHVMPPSWI